MKLNQLIRSAIFPMLLAVSSLYCASASATGDYKGCPTTIRQENNHFVADGDSASQIWKSVQPIDGGNPRTIYYNVQTPSMSGNNGGACAYQTSTLIYYQQMIGIDPTGKPIYQETTMRGLGVINMTQVNIETQALPHAMENPFEVTKKY